MNLSPTWIEWLRVAGWETSHWSTIGQANAPDDHIMAYAKEQGWVVLTNDLDFSAMLARSGEVQPTVIQIRADDLRTEAIGQAVLTALHQLDPEADAGALVTVEPNRTRVRILPFPKWRVKQEPA